MDVKLTCFLSRGWWLEISCVCRGLIFLPVDKACIAAGAGEQGDSEVLRTCVNTAKLA